MTTNPDRPLSPHLQVYNLPLSARLSITHRITGVLLIIGSVMVAAWIIAAAMGEDYYNIAMGWAQSQTGKYILIGWSAALYYHMLSGVRHMIMDTGRMISKCGAAASGWLIILGVIALTGLTWWGNCPYLDKLMNKQVEVSDEVQ